LSFVVRSALAVSAASRKILSSQAFSARPDTPMYAVRLWGIDKANLTADDIDLFVVIERV